MFLALAYYNQNPRQEFSHKCCGSNLHLRDYARVKRPARRLRLLWLEYVLAWYPIRRMGRRVRSFPAEVRRPKRPKRGDVLAT